MAQLGEKLAQGTYLKSVSSLACCGGNPSSQDVMDVRQKLLVISRGHGNACMLSISSLHAIHFLALTNYSLVRDNRGDMQS